MSGRAFVVGCCAVVAERLHLPDRLVQRLYDRSYELTYGNRQP